MKYSDALIAISAINLFLASSYLTCIPSGFMEYNRQRIDYLQKKIEIDLKK